MRGRRTGWVVVFALAACTIPQKRAAVAKATEDPGRRHDAFEATLRVLDEEPGYVDEFFALAREHPKTLGRFLEDTAGALHDRTLAGQTAHALVRAPQGLQRVLEETIDASIDRPAAREATLAAMRSRRVKLAEVLSKDPTTAKALVQALLAVQGANLEGTLRGLLRGPGSPGEAGQGARQ